MVTMILMLMVGALAFVVTPWVGSLNQGRLHSTDLMAGDEGED